MAPLRKDVERLLAQARRDLRNAEKNIDVEAFEVAAFLCQQAIEKALKALYTHARRKRAPATHSLTELGQELSAPKTMTEALATLSPDYVVSRYPDAANGVPGEIYTRRMAEERVAAAKEIWAWIEKQL
jgi:HEPN domain-containing protein